jgi:hypothetical protein
VAERRRCDEFVIQENTGVSFRQPGQRQRDTSKDKCYYCLVGHHTKNCANREAEKMHQGEDVLNVKEEEKEVETELAASRLQDGAEFFDVNVSGEELEFMQGVGFLDARSMEHRVTCDHTKLYLNTCTTNDQ